MSNRARRAHTYALRRRLIPPRRDLITIRLRLTGLKRPTSSSLQSGSGIR